MVVVPIPPDGLYTERTLPLAETDPFLPRCSLMTLWMAAVSSASLIGFVRYSPAPARISGSIQWELRSAAVAITVQWGKRATRKAVSRTPCSSS